jgi:hypothetical protein
LLEFFSKLNVATCCKSTLYTIQRVYANNIIWGYWLRMQVGISSWPSVFCSVSMSFFLSVVCYFGAFLIFVSETNRTVARRRFLRLFKYTCWEAGAYLGFCRGGCTYLADLPPSPPDLDPDPHQDFELDPDLHQNNADSQNWAQLSKDCCLIYNHV